jgi:ABC-type sugar transport system substrate-binding protein
MAGRRPAIPRPTENPRTDLRYPRGMGERVVVSLTSKDQEYQALQGEDAREAGRRLGMDVEVVFAEDNAVLQIQQLFRFVHAGEGERPAALIVHTRVPDGLERVAKNAVQAGIGWVLLNRTAPYVDTVRREYPRIAVAAVTTDHLEIGRIQADQLVTLCPEGANVIYIQGPADASAATLRLEGLQAALRGRPYERLRPDWARLPFLGCDGLPKGGKLDVDEGRLAATVTMPSCASPAVELVGKWIRSGVVPPAGTVLAPSPYPAR